MNSKKFFNSKWIIIIIITICAAVATTEQGTAQTHISGITDNSDSLSHITLYIPIKFINCDVSFSKDTEKKIHTSFLKLPFCILVDDKTEKSHKNINEEDISKAPCDQECALNTGLAQGANRVIVGNIQHETKKIMVQAGAGDEYKYISKIITKELYTIEIKLLEVSTRKILVHFSKTFESQDVDSGIAEIVKELEKKFTPLEDEEALKKKKAPMLNFGIANSFMVPFGRFQNVTDFSEGIQLNFGGRNLFGKNIIVMLSGGYYFASVLNKVKFFQAGSLAFQSGYMFKIHPSVWIAPIGGIGYMFHSMQKNSFDNRNIFSDPLVVAGVEIGYSIYKNLNVFCFPSFNFFFEQSYTGMYFSLNICISYNLVL